MFFIANLSILQHNMIGSSFLKPASCLRLRSCAFVRRVFKADPVKQTEPGHGRTEWKGVGESEGEREPGVIERGIQWERESGRRRARKRWVRDGETGGNRVSGVAAVLGRKSSAGG